MRLLLLCILWLLCPAYALHAASADTVQGYRFNCISKVDSVSLSGGRVYLDPEKKGSFSNFRLLPQERNLSGSHQAISSNFWAEFMIVNHSAMKKEALFSGPFMYKNTLYLHSKSGDTTLRFGGAYYTPGQIFYSERLSSLIRLAPFDTCTVVVFTEVSKFSLLPEAMRVDLRDQASFRNSAAMTYFNDREITYATLAFLSILVFQILFILLQGFFMKKPEYVYYLMYISCIVVYYLMRGEPYLNLFYIFNRSPEFRDYFNNFLLFIPFFFYYRFARYFCDIRRHNLITERRIRQAEWFVLAVSMLILLNSVFRLVSPVFPVLLATLSFLFLSIYLLVIVYRIRNVLSRILVIGSLCALVTSITANIVSFFPSVSYSLYIPPLIITMIGVILEMIIFNAGLVFKARQSEIEQLEAQQKLLEESSKMRDLEREHNSERSRIAADLHDDIGATLSSISIISEAALQKERMGDSLSTIGLLEKIGRSARQTMSNMGDIVWAINPRNDEVMHLVNRMEAFAFEMLSNKNIEVDFAAEGTERLSGLSPDHRKNLYLIFKEAINNIAKYAQASRVQIRFEVSNNRLDLYIGDNGIGFDTEQQKKGNGLRTMPERARQIGAEFRLQSQPGHTEIHLSLRIPTKGD